MAASNGHRPASVRKPARVLIGDGHCLFRTGLAKILAASPEIEVVGQAKDGAEVVEYALSLGPDVVLMDLRMPRVSGVDATRLLARVAPAVRVLVLSAYDDRDAVAEAMDCGAVGVVGKDVTPEEIVEQIGDACTAQRPKATRLRVALSNRERHVLTGVAEGLSNKQIALRLQLSEKTVRNHLSRAFGKLKANNRTQAVLNAMRLGIQIF